MAPNGPGSSPNAPRYRFRDRPDAVDPAAIRYLGVWHPPENIASIFPNLDVLFSLGVGIDQFDLGSLPPDLPVVRMIEPGHQRGHGRICDAHSSRSSNPKLARGG